MITINKWWHYRAPCPGLHRVARGLVVRPQQESYNQIIIFPFPDKFSLSRAQLCSGGWTEGGGGSAVEFCLDELCIIDANLITKNI